MAANSLSGLARHRRWVVALVLVLVVLVVGVIAGKRGNSAPANVKVAFGTRVEQLGATSDLAYTNGWLASSGREDIGVYAGSQASNRQHGLFVILRVTQGGRRVTRVVVHGSGAVTLLRPARPASESAAFTTTLHFVTANGATGTLDLGSDRVTLSG